MDILILINTPEVTPRMFQNAISQKETWINDEEAIVTIVDLCAVDINKKYLTWLRKTKKEGEIRIHETFSHSDPYDIVLVIGNRHDLQDFPNAVSIVKYTMKLNQSNSQKDEVWH